jgi:integrase
MPRPNRGHQLKFYQPRGYKARQWVIFWYDRGTKREHATGLVDSRAVKNAEGYKTQWLAERERPSGPVSPDGMTVAQALDLYGTNYAPTVEDPERIGYAIDALLPFWGELPVSSVKGETCRRYAKERKVKRGKKLAAAAANTVRRELGTLNAALEYCRIEGYLTAAPAVWLPERGRARDRWLTRKEAAAILRAAKHQDKARLHLPTFILLGLYTGHRANAILTLQWQPNMDGGHVDLARGRIDFNPIGKKQTNKRRSHIPIPGPLLIHLRLVRARTKQFVIEVDGARVKSCKRSFATASREAKVEGVVRHTLRHTACTWFMHRGVDPELAAGWVGMDPATFRKVYLHHHPDYMGEALESFRKSPSQNPSLRRKSNAKDREQSAGDKGNGARKSAS